MCSLAPREAMEAAAATAAEAEALEAAEEGGLPHGWVAVEDESGRTYYWHEDTDATRWERPVGAAKAAKAAAAAAAGDLRLEAGHSSPEAGHSSNRSSRTWRTETAGSYNGSYNGSPDLGSRISNRSPQFSGAVDVSNVDGVLEALDAEEEAGAEGGGSPQPRRDPPADPRGTSDTWHTLRQTRASI